MFTSKTRKKYFSYYFITNKISKYICLTFYNFPLENSIFFKYTTPRKIKFKQLKNHNSFKETKKNMRRKFLFAPLNKPYILGGTFFSSKFRDSSCKKI